MLDKLFGALGVGKREVQPKERAALLRQLAALNEMTRQTQHEMNLRSLRMAEKGVFPDPQDSERNDQDAQTVIVQRQERFALAEKLGISLREAEQYGGNDA